MRSGKVYWPNTLLKSLARLATRVPQFSASRTIRALTPTKPKLQAFSFSRGVQLGISRRKFIGAGAAAAAALTLDRSASAAIPRISVVDRGKVAETAFKPVVVASANGIRGVARA